MEDLQKQLRSPEKNASETRQCKGAPSRSEGCSQQVELQRPNQEDSSS